MLKAHLERLRQQIHQALPFSVGWADLAVVPLVAILSVPPLLWSAHHWTVIGNDAARYLLAGSELVSSRDLRTLSDVWLITGGHGPVFPTLIGSLVLVFGRDAEALAWAVRILALLNPLLAYFLAKRLSSPLAGLIAAALLTLFGYNVKATNPFNIDAVLLTFYLSALLALLAAINRDGLSRTLALLSGVLLGASILTKETAFAGLPLALIAALLLDWELRGALWHYLGVVLACLPWWIWSYLAGRVYVIDRLPPSLQAPVLVAAAVLLILSVAAYASGMVDSFLSKGSRRWWAGWFVVVGWFASLSGLVLAAASHELTGASFRSVSHYLAELLAPTTVVVPVVLVTVGYLLWKALRQDRSWRLLGLALVFQMPLCLLVVVKEWAPRQFLVPQTLVLCVLAALAADAAQAALRGRAYPARLVCAVIAVPLMLLLVVACAERVQALLPNHPGSLFEQRRVSPQASEMVDWMTENVPEGERILVSRALGRYLIFLDGGRHEWTFLRLDQEPCEPRLSVHMRCNPDQNAISRIPHDALYVQMVGECRVISLSMPNLLEQVRRTGSGYVMITGTYKLPGLLELPSLLQESGAFEIVYAEDDSDLQGAVLLKGTGQAPEAVPTLLSRNAVPDLRHCVQARGQEYSSWSRSKFPNGILEVTMEGANTQAEQVPRRIAKEG